MSFAIEIRNSLLAVIYYGKFFEHLELHPHGLEIVDLKILVANNMDI